LDVLENGLVREETLAKLALDDLAEEAQVLPPQRQVETKPGGGDRDLVLRRAMAADHLHGGARPNVRQDESEGEHAEHRAHRENEALDDITCHRSRGALRGCASDDSAAGAVKVPEEHRLIGRIGDDALEIGAMRNDP